MKEGNNLKVQFFSRFIPSFSLLIFLLVNLLSWGQASLPVTGVATTSSSSVLPTGFTSSGLGTAYASATTPLKFDTSSDNVIMNFNSAPGTLTYNLTNNSLSGSYNFEVYESADGSTYTLLNSYTSITTGSFSNSSLNAATRYIKWVYTLRSAGNVGLGTIGLTASSTSPTMSTTGTLSALSTTTGTASSSSTFTCSGTNLTNNITLTAPSGFEISVSSGSGYATSITLTQASGTVASTTIYVRLAAATSAGTYSGNVSCTSTGATTVNVATTSSTVNSTSTSLATDYFRSLATGNWNTAGSWQSSPDNSTWITSTLVPTSSAASVTIQTGHTITINANATAPSLTIAGTGKLTFDGVAARNFTMTGSLTISASGGSFITQSSGTFTNTFNIAGDISNAGTFDMSRNGTTLVCTVTFNKNGNQTVSGAGATTRFSYVVVNMGTSNSNILDIASSNFSACANFLHSDASAANQLQNGTIKFSGSYTFANTLFQQGTYYNIVATAGIWLNNSNVTTTGVDDSYDLRGLLRITSGTFNVGTASGNSLKYFTGSVFTLEGGAVNVAGRFYPNSIGQTTTCTISGGTITLIKMGSSTASSKFAGFQMTAASTFVWSNGTIVLQQGQAYYGGMDYSDASTSSTITGGTLQICNSSSTGGVDAFYFYSVNSIPNLTITTTNAPIVYLFSNLTVLGNISIASGATLDVQADPDAYTYEAANVGTTVYVATTTYTISLKGNWINNGTFTARDKTVTFNGVSAQGLSGSTTTSFYNLTMNNTSTTGLTFSTPAIVTAALTLTDGNIYTSNPNYLTMNAGSTSTSGSAASFVDGPMKKIGSTEFVFPLGDGTRWRRIKISSLSASETFTSQYVNTAYSNVSSMKVETSPLVWVSNTEYWTLTRAGAVDAVVELYWEDATASSLPTCADLRIAHWDNVNNYWEKANIDAVTTTGLCTGTNSGTIYSNADIAEFSPFTFGSITITLLPVELISFDAQLKERQVELTWVSSSEFQNDYYTIEKTTDGIHYEFVGTQTATGNSAQINSYSLYDANPYQGVSYYRLKQTDFDGNEHYFDLRTIENNLNNYSTSFSIFPNPVQKNETISLQVHGKRSDLVNIVITDPTGKMIYFTTEKLSQENTIFTFQLPSNLDSGMYLLSTTLNGRRTCEKLIIQ
jgi:hypothetical protein